METMYWVLLDLFLVVSIGIIIYYLIKHDKKVDIKNEKKTRKPAVKKIKKIINGPW